ncbi:MAG: ABC transporter substrate-binding protein [Polyangiales bacterium]
MFARIALVAGLSIAVFSCTPTPPETDALRVVIPREVESLDPRFIRDPYGLKISRLIFRSLFTIDPRTLELVPDLAESHRFRTPSVLEVTLKAGQRFNDGSPIEARDVVATFMGVKDPEVGSAYAGTFERFSSIRALDARRIELILAAPHATVLSDLEFPVLRAEDARRNTPERETFTGSGPYSLVRWTSSHVILERSQSAPENAPERIDFVVVRDDNGRALRMEAGGADIALNGVTALLLPRFESDEAFEVRSTPGIGTSYLGFNLEGATHDVRLRRAISHAINTELLIETELGGRAELASSWIPTGHWADASASRPAYDPALSRALVAELGAGGRRLVLRTSADRARVSICRAIAAMLREVGLEVEVQPSENATLIADLNAGRFDMTFLQVPEVFEPHVLHWFFASERVPEGAQVGANRWRIRDHRLDEALEAGRSVMDRTQRRAAYAIVQQRLADELPVLPLWQEHNVAVVRAGTEFDVPRDGRFRTLFR